MLRKRLLILLGGCLVMASGAWADDVGFVDCSNHSEETQVFGKARKGPDMVGSVPCGERFTILVYGFIFTRIQTRDGKVGFIYSNLISVDRSGAAVLQPASERVPVPRSSAPQRTAMAAQPAPATQARPEPVTAQPAATPPTAPQVTPATPVATPVVTPAAPVAPPPATSNASVTTAAVAQPNLATPAQPEPAVAQPTPAQIAAPVAATLVAPAPTAPAAEPTVAANPTETVAPAAQPAPATVSQPQPAPVEPAAPAVRDASLRSSWERPIPGARRRTAPVELFGGYAFARLDGGGGSGTNLNGALGSFGWNMKPWLQIVADSSYSVVTVSGVKNVLYGNHFGPRYFHRGRNRWGATPFVEALFGGSRADTKVSGPGGYTTSDSSFSIKVGGGLDIHPSRRLEIRVFDVDYYRTSFGTNLHQNNYWASTGIVIRLFGGGGAE
jgi:hypothetical protein